MNNQPLCELCGEPMPVGEEMFKYHGFSGACPNPPLPNTSEETLRNKIGEIIWRNQPAKINGLDDALNVADQILDVISELAPIAPKAKVKDK